MSAIVWWFEQSLLVPFLRIGRRVDLFQSCGHCWVFQICWHIECSTLIASSFRIWNSLLRFCHLHWLYWPQCFLRPTWLHTPECLTLCEWLHHRGYLGHQDLFCTVLLCILAISSWSLLLLLYLHHFCPLLCPSLDEMSLWYFQFSWRDFQSLPFCHFPLFHCIVHWKVLLVSPCYSLELCI